MTCSNPAPDPSAHLAALQAGAHPNCFACSSSNPMGLALRYSVAPDGSVSASFIGNCALESYPGVLHGGLVATVLDGAMTNCLFAHGIRALTAELTVRYHDPVQSTEELQVRAWLESSRHGVLALRATLTQNDRIKARAQAKFIAPRQPSSPPDHTGRN
jgi:acyl-coenzyme A thioesterase PaaI-like protein